MLTELYKAGKVRQEALGVLAKSVICAKTGCLTSGPEAVFGNLALPLTESLTAAPRQKAPQQRRQTPKLAQPQPKRQEQKQQQPPEQRPAAVSQPPKPQETKVEEKREEASWGSLVALLAEEARVDRSKAEAVIDALMNYLSIYPSVGVIRLVEDVSRLAKVEHRAVRAALEILRSADVVELREEGVVNLRKLVRRGDIKL
ncbi:hypothetical protein [Pyrobaculum neutrophilum]|uniref:Uncharacterized protein n=1 Tax=Pyrobaculum neutrophilum (strain DSM 2338 / JCM 9278 / NBRC 100436 / V24Sta) TaxID=444157 RepID=B1Y951_PYRNV|nr:hypothetical protein [Pyrobaculum neutrophilum]ACB40280.1 conserved hypothetical protein [Pyrobaculum neutrophilum V24Sta]